MKASTAALALCLLLTSGAWAQADPADPWLSQALDAYARALEESDRDARLAGFGRAEQLFGNAVEAGGHNAALQTNLGNAALLAEDRGAAVLAYKRALRLDADFPRALQNLEHVRNLQPTWVPRPQPAGLFDSFFFYRAVPRADRALAAGVAFAVGGLLVGLSLRWPRVGLRGAGILAFVAWAALFTTTWFDGSDRDANEAVIVSDETPARSADSALAPLAFPEPLPAGTEVHVAEVRSPWARVRLANGRDAWVQESSVTRVDP